MLRQDLVYDLGLHLGEDTEFYLRKGFNVVAFEANPTMVRHCSQRFSSAIDDGRLTIIEGAVAPGPEGESVTFYVNSKSQWSTVDSVWRERNESLQTSASIIAVPRIDFDRVLHERATPYYMKIDIEGMDRHILNCLKRARDLPTLLSIESEKVDFEKLLDDMQRLKDLGYRRFRAVQQSGIPNSRVEVQTRTGTAFTYVFAKHASGPFGEDLRQPWLSFDAIVEEYRKIFRRYRWFGDNSLLRRSRPGWLAMGAIEKLTGIPLPGWHDLHVSL